MRRHLTYFICRVLLMIVERELFRMQEDRYGEGMLQLKGTAQEAYHRWQNIKGAFKVEQ